MQVIPANALNRRREKQPLGAKLKAFELTRIGIDHASLRNSSALSGVCRTKLASDRRLRARENGVH